MKRIVISVLLWAASGAAQPPPPPDVPACQDGPRFDAIPMALEDFLAFRPLGFLSLPIHIFPAKHSAFSLALPGQPSPERPVRFPGDAWVTEIWFDLFPDGQTAYQLIFYPCSEFQSYFSHIKDVPERLKAAYEQSEKSCMDFVDLTGKIVKCRARVLVRVSSGELAGISGNGAGVDFGAIDFRVAPVGFVNLEHYSHDYPYYVSPVDYFVPGLKAQFETKLGGWDGQTPRTAEPKAGSYRQDLAGTAQGNWFYPGLSLRNTTDLSPFLALVHDYIEPSQPVFSIGTKVAGVRMGLYSFVPRDTALVNRDFKDVTASGDTYCYEDLRAGRTAGGLPLGNLEGVLLVSMPSPTTLMIERQGTSGQVCADLPDWRFTESATTYER